MLDKQSFTKLRSIAQAYGIKDFLSMTQGQLVQAIEVKQRSFTPEPKVEVIEKPEYDARLMSRPPAKICTEETLREMLGPHIKRGLHLTFPEPETWHMSFSKKEDTGTMRQPLRNVLKCADRMLA